MRQYHSFLGTGGAGCIDDGGNIIRFDGCFHSLQLFRRPVLLAKINQFIQVFVFMQVFIGINSLYGGHLRKDMLDLAKKFIPGDKN